LPGDIFLSYSRSNQVVADAFFQAAEKIGLSVWYDQLIPSGNDWREAIVDALNQCKALVILFSEASNSSLQLIKELAVADNFGKLVIPILIEHTQPRGAYLYEMAARSWISLYPDPATKMDYLVSRISAQLHNTVPCRAAINEGEASWFPLRRYDVLFPIILVVDAIAHANGFKGGVTVNLLLILIYMIMLAVRNAQLNRGPLSPKSFFSYVLAGSLILPFGVLPDWLSGEQDANVKVAIGLLILCLAMGGIANILQVVLRRVHQLRKFREKIEKVPQ